MKLVPANFKTYYLCFSTLSSFTFSLEVLCLKIKTYESVLYLLEITSDIKQRRC